jgi:lysophospholipid acyltransferase (LPLAT)-like uncharacterized protein
MSEDVERGGATWLFARAIAAMLTGWARFCGRTSRIELPADAAAVLSRTWDGEQPVIYVYWHDEFVLNVLLPIHWKASGLRADMPVCGANDAFGGKVIQACLSGLGVPLALMPRRADRAAKLQTLVEALRVHRRLLLAGDYGRPWFKARPTAFQLARATGGVVVSMHLHVDRPWVVSWGGWKMTLPRPFTRYEWRLRLLDADLALEDAALVAPLTAALDSLRADKPQPFISPEVRISDDSTAR